MTKINRIKAYLRRHKLASPTETAKMFETTPALVALCKWELRKQEGIEFPNLSSKETKAKIARRDGLRAARNAKNGHKVAKITAKAWAAGNTDDKLTTQQQVRKFKDEQLEAMRQRAANARKARAEKLAAFKAHEEMHRKVGEAYANGNPIPSETDVTTAAETLREAQQKVVEMFGKNDGQWAKLIQPALVNPIGTLDAKAVLKFTSFMLEKHRNVLDSEEGAAFLASVVPSAIRLAADSLQG